MSLSGLTGGVLSTLNTGLQGPVADTYGFYQGTSMGAPHVSGVTSLLYSLIPSLTPAQALQILGGTATAFPPGSACNISICGSGIVNAYFALSTLPRLTSISPNKAETGSTPTLTVNGANFNSSYSIVWNGVMLSTTFVSSSSLTAQLTPFELSTSGVFHVSVSGMHPVFGSMTTSSLAFLVGLDRTIFLPLAGR